MNLRKLSWAPLLSACLAVAQAASPPDFSGFWMLSRSPPVQDPVLAAALPPGTVILDDHGAKEYGRMDFGPLQLRPEALEKARAWKAADDMTVAAACRIPSIVYAMQGPFPIEIHQGRDLMVIELEYFDMDRVVFLDGRGPRPADAARTKEGYSRGRWEGDTLVVETSHIKAATITNNGLDHSDAVTVVERFRLSADGRKLVATQEFDDPQTLLNRGARFITWERVEGDHVHAYDCDPSFAENYAD
ncbi:MAG: hypothetical protein RL026_205 [Pseudomonadota bacterium]|jgi:hypothetical protein